MTRRDFFIYNSLGLSSVLLPNFVYSFISDNSYNINIFNDLIKKFPYEKIIRMPFGDLISEIAKFFIGFEYIGGTLDKNLNEQVTIDFKGLDCVTFYENSLCLARILINNKRNFKDLINEIQFTRYRNGILTDFTSRLHYTSEWIIDNIEKGVITDITKSLGGNKITPKPDFMSKNPNFYKSMKENPSLVKKISEIERNIAKTDLSYIDKHKIASIENQIRNGDYIAIVTNKKGLDYAHVGMAVRINDECRLMHASLKQKKVIIDGTISKYLNSIESHLGITIARPMISFTQINE